MVKLAGPLTKFGVPLVENVLVLLATMAAASVIEGAIQRKTHGSRVRAVRAGKEIPLFISN